jgi:diguanylate cyclase (GGDEF)-like protein
MKAVLTHQLQRIGRSKLSAFLLLPILYYLGASFGSTFTATPEGLAILWPANSVLLAALLYFRGRHWAPIVLVAFGAEIAADLPNLPLRDALLYAVTNVTEASLAFALLTRWRFDPRFAALEDVKKFVVAGPLLAAFTSALIGASVHSVFFGTETSYLEFLRIWWFGDALGLMIFTPLFLSLWPRPNREPPAQLAIRPSDALIAVLALAALGLLIASRNGFLFGVHIGPVLLLPFIIFVAARYDTRWVACAVALVALVTVVMLTRGNNPFGNLPARDSIVQAQEFIFIMSLLGLGQSTILAQLRAKQRETEVANRHLNALNRDLEKRVVARTSELSALNIQLTHLALTDSLTGLLNRRAFFDVAERESERSKRRRRPLAVMLLDIDHFKTINDRYGHQVGDQVLQQAAALLGGTVRAEDTLARYGGEEFVILVPEADVASAISLATRLLNTLRAAAFPSEQGAIYVTASLGVAVTSDSQEPVAQLLKRADEGLYAAKAGGRDRLVVVMPCQPQQVVVPN